MPETDYDTEAEVLATFLRAEPGEWQVLAPRVVEVVGLQRLHTIVEATRQRVGDPLLVRNSAQGLVIEGPKGGVLAWVHTDDGHLDALAIAPYRLARRTAGWAGSLRFFRLGWIALLVWLMVDTWTASHAG